MNLSKLIVFVWAFAGTGAGPLFCLATENFTADTRSVTQNDTFHQDQGPQNSVPVPPQNNTGKSNAKSTPPNPSTVTVSKKRRTTVKARAKINSTTTLRTATIKTRKQSEAPKEQTPLAVLLPKKETDLRSEVAHGRIIQGTETKQGDYPFAVSLQNNESFIHFCMGSLLTERKILTACHCVTYTHETSDGASEFMTLEPISISVLAGTVQVVVEGPRAQRRNCTEVAPHPMCSVNETGFYNDYAIIAVGKEFKIDPGYVQILPLPVLNSTNIIDDLCRSKGRCIAIGWGRTNAYQMFGPNVMMQAPLRLLIQSECASRMEEVLSQAGSHLKYRSANEICTVGDQNQDTCNGDSGGPLMCEYEGEMIPIATVSWGISCGIKGRPGIWARLDQGEQWIKEMMVLRSSSFSSRSAPIQLWLLLAVAKLNYHRMVSRD